MVQVLIAAVVVLIVACIFLAASLARAGHTVSRLKRVASEVQELQTRAAELERQNHLFGKLIRDYLGFMRELYRVSSLRRIPELLLKFMTWLFEPTDAVVLIRRRPAVADQEREHQLIVAASQSSMVKQGTVIPLSDGPLSRVASSGIVLDHFAGERGSELPGLSPDLMVPLAADDEILGVLALMQPRRQQPHARQLLQLFAQSAALAHRNASTLNRIRSEADLDGLTGVLNRGALMVLLEKFVEETRAAGRPLSVFLFDIDHFKNYNDANGHLPGDDCLRLLARLVSEQTRADDAFGRYGGEEFLLVLKGRDGNEAEHVAEKIRRIIAEYPFPHGETQPLGAVTISGGIACIPDHARTVDEVLRIADKALYDAKNSGRNRVFLSAIAPVVIPDDTRTEPLPAEPDDLEKIRGIGAAYAQALFDSGIISFRQIAELDWRGIDRLAAQLKTNPERIIREEWLSQARQLHAETHGEELDSSA